jgi:PAS domain S-box-containing protein
MTSRRSPRRLQIQVALLGALLLAGVLAAFTAMMIRNQTGAEAAALEDRARTLALNLTADAAEMLAPRRQTAIEELLLRGAEYPEVLAIQALDRDGNVLADVVRDDGRHSRLRSGTLNLAPPGAGRPPVQTLRDRIVLWEPVDAPDRLGWLRLEVGNRSVGATRAHILRDAAVAGAAILFLGVLLLTVLLRRPVRAVERATQFAGRLDELRGQTFPVQRCSLETEQLGEALNRVSRRLAEQELTINATTRRLEAILQHAIDGIVTIDAHGVIEDMNPAAAATFGHAAADLIGHPFCRLVPDFMLNEDGQDSDPPPVLHGETRVEFEVAGVRADGLIFPLMIGLSRIEIESRELYVAVVRDISESRMLDRMKDEFIASVTHELRTPLTSLHGLLDLLATREIATIDGKAHELAQRAYRNSTRLVRLINDIVDFERIEFGEIAFNARVSDLAALLRKVVEANTDYAEARGVWFDLELPPVSVHALVDENLLARAVTHLLTNAARHSPAHEAVRVQMQPFEHAVRISVSDHGPGIPEQERRRIFEKFTHVAGNDARYKDGAGLGLTIARAIVGRLGGNLDFTSSPGVATTFYIDLPQAEDA